VTSGSRIWCRHDTLPGEKFSARIRHTTMTQVLAWTLDTSIIHPCERWTSASPLTPPTRNYRTPTPRTSSRRHAARHAVTRRSRRGEHIGEHGRADSARPSHLTQRGMRVSHGRQERELVHLTQDSPAYRSLPWLQGGAEGSVRKASARNVRAGRRQFATPVTTQPRRSEEARIASVRVATPGRR
jgi:hypothetical protein